MRCLFIISCCFIVFECRHNSASDKAQEIIDEAIAAHGGKNFNYLNLAFDFKIISIMNR